MTTETLSTLKLITSTIAPILTFILALLGAFTEKKKDKEFKVGGKTYTKKVLTLYGKTIITLLVISALVTLSGLYVDELIKDRKAQVQKELDEINNSKRDSILNTAKLTLDSVVLALKTTQKVQQAAQDLQKTAEQTTNKVKSLLQLQAEQLELSNSINTKVDPVDSLYVWSQMVLRDEDDVFGMNKGVSRDRYSSATAGYREPEIRIYLFGQQFDKQQVLNQINRDFYQHPDAFGRILKNMDLHDYFLIQKQDTNFRFIRHMDELYQGVIFNWSQKAGYVAGISKRSFSSLRNSYFIASVRSSRGFFLLNNFRIMNNGKTNAYKSSIELLKKLKYESLFNTTYHTIFVGKFIYDKFGQETF